MAQAASTTAPLVSIIAVCYNHARYVVECLESIRDQTYLPIELIIMDDCSRDDSVSIMKKWLAETGMTAKFVAHSRNVGLCSTLNEALTYAHGQFVSIVATDDVYMPDKIERQVNQLMSLDSEYAVSYGDMMMIDEAGGKLPGLTLDWVREKYTVPPSGDLLGALLHCNVITAPTVLFRSSVFRQVGVFDETLSYEDYDMWLRIAQLYKFAYCDTVLARYRIVSSSIQRTLLDTDNPRRYQDNASILLKCMDTAKLDSGLWRSVLKKVARDAEHVYRLGGKRAAYLLWRTFRYSLTVRSFIIALAATFRIPYSPVIRLISYLNWRISLLTR